MHLLVRHPVSKVRFLLTLACLGGLAACGKGPGEQLPPEEEPPPVIVPSTDPVVIPQKLSELALFTGGPGSDGKLTPTAGNVPYELNAVLFSDHALKARTIYQRPGAVATYDAEQVLDFPIGTIFTKTFSFPADFRQPTQNVRVVETRILVRQPTGWEAWPYVWDSTGTEATLAPGGKVTHLEFTDASGQAQSFDYLVPSKNQCLQCHHLQNDAGEQIMRPIGPKARNLNRDNQLEQMAATGRLQGLPATGVPRAPRPFDPATGTLEERARAYLDVNCAHCHQPKGTAGIASRLFLDVFTTNPQSLGICKRPGSAGGGLGGEFDVLPGDSAHSILWTRVQTSESGKMMPQIGRTVTHVEGAQLIADWIDAMPPQTCH